MWVWYTTQSFAEKLLRTKLCPVLIKRLFIFDREIGAGKV